MRLPKPRSTRELMLLADAGATHTRAVVATREGRVLGRGEAGPANPFAVGPERALANLKHALNSAVASVGVRPTTFAVVVVGSAGVAYNGHGATAIKRELKKRFLGGRFQVVADARIALEGALAGKPGVVIVCGTGSIVLGKDATERMIRIGGWGPVMGDEGSAQWLGREALRRAAQAADGTGPATALRHAILRHYQLANFERVVDVVYAHPVTAAELGELAPLVTRAAQRGDAVAREIFRRSAQALAQQAAQAVKLLGLRRPRVSYQGAVFRVGDILLNPLRAELRRCAPGTRLVAPLLPPLGGAFFLAMKTQAWAPDREAIGAFRKATRG